MLGQCLHNGTLQLASLVLTRSYGIDADGHNNAVFLKHLFRDASRQTMYLVGIHRVIDIDMQRADKDIWSLIVKDDIEHAMNTIKCPDLLLDVVNQFLRDSSAQQFVDRRCQHLYTCLDDYQGD